MNDNILSASGKAFQKFISHLTQQLTRPKAKFIGQLLCGVLFSNNLILTNIASKVPCASRLTAKKLLVLSIAHCVAGCILGSCQGEVVALL